MSLAPSQCTPAAVYKGQNPWATLLDLTPVCSVFDAPRRRNAYSKMEPRMPSIPEWFRNRNVLVTGGTGFMGKVLISKLLSSCADLGSVFLLVREKKGMDPQTRLHSILQQEPFRVLAEKHGERLKKIVVIPGDITEEGFSLSRQDRERLIDEVSVVFHMAANVRFDLSLKAAVKNNVGSIANMVALAKEMRNLESFVHVSTAFSQCGEEVLEERAYPPALSPESVLQTVNSMPDNVVEAMMPKILGHQPNTYAFTKALGEDIVERSGLPAAVARPSIVVASWKEPAPGWVDNMNGPTGMMIGAGKGVIRSMLCNADYPTDMIPCDLTINALIGLAWQVGLEKPARPLFMNVTVSGENPISWGDAIAIGKRHALAHPFSGPLWYPGGRVTSAKLLHWLAVIFLHLLPAYVIDAMCVLTGNKPFLIRVQGRVSVGLRLLQYYTTKRWKFRKDRMKILQSQLCPSDKETFFVDVKSISWDLYLLDYILGARRYILKDDPSTMPRARRVFRYLYFADWCVKLTLAAFVLWILYPWTDVRRGPSTKRSSFDARLARGARGWWRKVDRAKEKRSEKESGGGGGGGGDRGGGRLIGGRFAEEGRGKRENEVCDGSPSERTRSSSLRSLLPRPSGSFRFHREAACSDRAVASPFAPLPRPSNSASFERRNVAAAMTSTKFEEDATRMEEVPDRLAQTFEGRSILITGGTGFMGKVMIEKFLRCLPKVGHIYMLVRVKRGKDPKQRLEEIFDSPLFETVKGQRGIEALRDAVTVVSGDVAQPALGLSPEDRKMLCEKVNIVYHAAATVRFDELLKRAVLLNTCGTKKMLELAKEMKNLLLFAYVSTAYCHLEEKVLGEQPYPPPADPHKIIKCVEWMDDDVVEAMTDKILGHYPNTYAFTKALAESLVEEAMAHIPAIILRPSIIIPIWKDPLPGWTDNINGPTGLLIGAGKGVIRTMYCNESGYADYVPVDISINAILAASWNFMYFKDRDKRVYNITSSSEYKVSWGEIIERGRKIMVRVPLNGIVWYPGGSMKKSRLVHNICVLLFHTVPAYLIDALIFLAGYEPVMCRVQRRINKGFEMFEYYANNQWDFVNQNLTEVRDKFNRTEYDLYQLHGNDLNIDAYFEDCIRAARIYILKEMPDTLPSARRHLRVMYWVDVFAKILLFALLIYAFVSWNDSLNALLGRIQM
ncbi:hypothetical protein KM043_001507 [Ampulex compressa]|nr:hypothetical protein KM043_001507 [Ampulex compressa]